MEGRSRKSEVVEVGAVPAKLQAKQGAQAGECLQPTAVPSELESTEQAPGALEGPLPPVASLG